MIKFNWFTFLVLLLLSHASLFYVLLVGSAWQVCAMLLLFLVECSFASTAVYHRLLSHRSWNAGRTTEIVGTVMGIFTFTGTPITRTLSHRYHHLYTDTELDPHSPSVAGILRTYFPMLDRSRKLDLKLVKDLMGDDFHKFIHRWYLEIILTCFLTVLLLTDFKWALAVVIAPGALSWMNISVCNIFCHLGKVGGRIRNDRILGYLTFGEGWHKHHHDFPNDACFGKGDFDLGYWWIRLLEKKGPRPKDT